METSYDELLSNMFKVYSTSGLGGDMKFVDSFFSFLRRKTQLLKSTNALNRIQEIALRHFSEAKKDAKKKDITSTTQSEKLDSQKDTTVHVEKPKDKDQEKPKDKDQEKSKDKDQDGDKKNEEKTEKKEDVGPPPPGNGGKTDRYTWLQTLKEVTVLIEVPKNISSKEMVVKIEEQHLKIVMRGNTLIDDELSEKIDSDNSSWFFDEEREKETKILNLMLPKKSAIMSWWLNVCANDPKINTSAIPSEQASLTEFDVGTREAVHNMVKKNKDQEKLEEFKRKYNEKFKIPPDQSK